MADILPFSAITEADAEAVGGKGLSLGLMAGAGLPVPAGFCITSAAHRRNCRHAATADPALAEAIVQAYRDLGGGPVAVRSSATSEDSAAASFAGQQETYLGVEGKAALLEAVGKCWASLDSERAVAYRRKQGVEERSLAMAVVVQRLVPAEVAGVLFTRDPLDPEGQRMLAEAAWGLGESVVSGAVAPDRFHLDRDTGAVLDRHISTKQTMRTAEGVQDVPSEKQNQACLDDTRLAELVALGRQIETFHGEARDVEWAWAGGRFWLLQARPITAGGAAERAQVRREEIAALRARAEPAGTVWSRFNLAEVLPEPTPMTWSVVRRFMSGRGGFGLMYRDLGFDPDRALDEEGIFDLVCGRPYCNLSREPRLYFRQLPFEHPFAALKAAPQKALYPQPVINPARGGWRFWLSLPILLPVLFWKTMRSELRIRRLTRSLAQRLREEILPAFGAETDRAAGQDLGRLDTAALLERLEHWIRRTLSEFARDSLKPTALAGVALKNVEKALARVLGAERTTAALGELTMGVKADPEADLPTGLGELAAGRMEQAAFLERFGHRARQEMELAQPRWVEDPAGLERLLAKLGKDTPRPADSPPLNATLDRVAAEAKLTEAQKTALSAEVMNLRTYLALRETAKHYLMKGYALIRRILQELDRRHGLNGGIYFLTLEELGGLAGGKDFGALIEQRRRRRQLAVSLDVPPVLFSDDLEAIGRPVPVGGAEAWQGVPLSAGVAEGPALVLTQPEGGEVPAEPYILVCPSTDPAWVPLFVHARGLVMETGGVLSHGAIVAREFGLPAVAGIADACRRLRTGSRLRVDGATGTVTELSDHAKLK
jgi:pyruvate,water dikinase